jgi:ABC-type uncharacterized transport system involved in gliding motility auxiliary subunit
LTTGPNAGVKLDNFDISPESIKGLGAPKGEKILLGASAEKEDMRFVAVASSFLIADQIMQNNPDNVSFVSNVIDWLAAEKNLSSIPSKTGGRNVFEFRSPSDIMLIQYGNLLLPPLFIIVFAVYHLRRRKFLTKRKYVQ